MVRARGHCALGIGGSGRWLGGSRQPGSDSEHHRRGHSPYVPPTDGVRIVNSDLAFWGNTAYQGTYNGFRIIDITDPDSPGELITYEECEGNQGDIMIWETLLIRTWNGPAPADDPMTPEDESVDCGGQDVPPGFEGLHFFDVSDPANPDLDSLRRHQQRTHAGGLRHQRMRVPHRYIGPRHRRRPPARLQLRVKWFMHRI